MKPTQQTRRRPPSHDPTATIGELQAQRQRLALDAEDGVRAALEALERVEAEFARLRLAEERRELLGGMG